MVGRVKRREARQRAIAAAHLDIEAAIDQLQGMSVGQVRKHWEKWLCNAPPRCQSGRALRMMLAWHLQEQRSGGYSNDCRRLLKEAMQGTTTRSGPPPRLQRGALLTREWKGSVHRVQVLDKGFAFEGKIYRSLSEIARRITGTRWSGPRFFGVEAPNFGTQRAAS